eukprot:925999-Rhodomonas_salina.2
MQRNKLAEFAALKQRAAEQTNDNAIDEIVDINSRKEFPELEQSTSCLTQNKSDDHRCFKAAFCNHELAPQAAAEMAHQAYLHVQWSEPLCELQLTLQQEGFGELRFRYVEAKWRDDLRGAVKSINKLSTIHLDSARAVKEGLRSAKDDPNRPDRVPDDRITLSVAADWEKPSLVKLWASGLNMDGMAAALQPQWLTELCRILSVVDHGKPSSHFPAFDGGIRCIACILLFAGVPPMIVPRIIASQLAMCGAQSIEYVTPEELARMDVEAPSTQERMDSNRLPWHMVLGTTQEAALLYDFSRLDGVEFGVWLGTGPFDDSCFGVR